MTRDSYLEMCDSLGQEPDEEDIPVDITDLPYEVQDAYTIYGLLSPKIAEFSGTYLGRDFSELEFYFKMFETPSAERRFYFRIIMLINNITTEVLQTKQEAKRAQSKSNKGK